MSDRWVVVVFGDKGRHSDVVGPFDYRAGAESFAEQDQINSGRECRVFCLVSEGQYVTDNYGCAHCGSDGQECIEGCRYQGGEGDGD